MIATSTEALTIDKEFEALCRKLKPLEFDVLESQIETDGCRDPIVVWANHDNIILDGHNRYDICTRLGRPFKTKAITLDDRDACLIWIAANQLGRRNLDDEAASYLRGKMYEALKRKQGAQEGSKNAAKNKVATVTTLKTAEKMAMEHGVSEKTIRNDARFAAAVDTLAENVGEEAREAVMTKEIPRKEAVAIAKLPKEEQPAAVKLAVEKPAKEAGKTKSFESYWEEAHRHLDKAAEVCDRATSSHTKLVSTPQYKNLLDWVKKGHRLIDSLERKAKT